MQKLLVVIAGPTAVGKTDFCVRLAQMLNTEVISADSRQFYRELSIGTAKPSEAEFQGITHHFINSHSIGILYSAGSFERDALAVLDKLYEKQDVVILTGGSGLYIKAVCEGLDNLPETPPELRAELMHRLEVEGLESLQTQLRALDPVYCESNDLQNTQRVVRALEVCLLTGKPFSSFREHQPAQRPFRILQIVLERNREELYQRIDRRMEQMLAAGLVEEARSLVAYREHNALQTVGYKEVFDFLDGQYDYEEMVRLLKRNSRRYAKRQITWFKHQGNFKGFQADDFEGVLTYIQSTREALE
ncbi:tRNA (adenosine(37)-N6)-dimethylallyltransferase MiaA [Runella rosea]|uniref:tRNA dimethylallyltransferase n=1 Tax=Runella rosea TaxID=2259595 RepID=A0A344TQK1_9BACT|nr:tRNA (adenosine(37)-N6)-dimethylallyltransferase MiaA [Runella rosea]AXE20922.1 tRNA (adenosine(37)-N6)-dimethylallyltransferase MiaA [Runella rosea]